MDIVAAVWKWLNDNAGVIGVLFVVLPLAWSAWEYLRLKRREIQQHRFQTYHKLIQQLVEREDPNHPLKLDRQIAVVFELRNFKEYFPVTLRILKGLREDWEEHSAGDPHNRLVHEIDLSIAFIETKV
jgi:hypothetical protein